MMCSSSLTLQDTPCPRWIAEEVFNLGTLNPSNNPAHRTMSAKPCYDFSLMNMEDIRDSCLFIGLYDLQSLATLDDQIKDKI